MRHSLDITISGKQNPAAAASGARGSDPALPLLGPLLLATAPPSLPNPQMIGGCVHVRREADSRNAHNTEVKGGGTTFHLSPKKALLEFPQKSSEERGWGQISLYPASPFLFS